MRLLFAIEFYTGDRWKECEHSHQVLVCEDLKQACELVYSLRILAKELIESKFPQEKDRDSAVLGPDEVTNELDPLFQLIDGYFCYTISPVVELSAAEVSSYREFLWTKTQLLAKGASLIEEIGVNSPEQLEFPELKTKSLSKEKVPEMSSFGQALKTAIDLKKSFS